jgi:signal transduction histidine kinase
LDSINAGVLVLDQDLCPTLVNPRLRELVGEVDMERARALLGERLAEVLRHGVQDVLPLECERMVEGPDGVRTPVHLTLSEILLTETGRAGYALVFQDISRVKRLEVETARSRRLAALGEMAASIAHEVRSPLGGIELYASLLKENAEGETNRRASEILTAVHRLHTTISHLLSFVAEPQISGEALPASVLVKEVGELAAPLLRTGQWTLAITVEPGLPPLWGDRGLLVQALMNLVTNAIDAMPQGGRVQIAALQAPFSATQGCIHREIELRVTDEGVGISPENRERIFDPFFSTKPKGTGLGLALTHKILCAHGGSISVAPAPERGSCFTLLLPAADAISRVAPIPQGKAQKGKVCRSVLS